MSARRQTRHPKVTEETIAQRAYEIWQQRGCPVGDGADDWQAARDQLQAEHFSNGRFSDDSSLPPRRRPLKRLFAKLRNRAAL